MCSPTQLLGSGSECCHPSPAPCLPMPSCTVLPGIGTMLVRGVSLSLASVALQTLGKELKCHCRAGSKPLLPMLDVSYCTFATSAWVVHLCRLRWRDRDWALMCLFVMVLKTDISPFLFAITCLSLHFLNLFFLSHNKKKFFFKSLQWYWKDFEL